MKKAPVKRCIIITLSIELPKNSKRIPMEIMMTILKQDIAVHDMLEPERSFQGMKRVYNKNGNQYFHGHEPINQALTAYN